MRYGVKVKSEDLGRANYTASSYTRKTEMSREMVDFREKRYAHADKNSVCIRCEEYNRCRVRSTVAP